MLDLFMQFLPLDSSFEGGTFFLPTAAIVFFVFVLLSGNNIYGFLFSRICLNSSGFSDYTLGSNVRYNTDIQIMIFYPHSWTELLLVMVQHQPIETIDVFNFLYRIDCFLRLEYIIYIL